MTPQDFANHNYSIVDPWWGPIVGVFMSIPWQHYVYAAIAGIIIGCIVGPIMRWRMKRDGRIPPSSRR